MYRMLQQDGNRRYQHPPGGRKIMGEGRSIEATSAISLSGASSRSDRTLSPGISSQPEPPMPRSDGLCTPSRGVRVEPELNKTRRLRIVPRGSREAHPSVDSTRRESSPLVVPSSGKRSAAVSSAGNSRKPSMSSWPSTRSSAPSYYGSSRGRLKRSDLSRSDRAIDLLLAGLRARDR